MTTLQQELTTLKFDLNNLTSASVAKDGQMKTAEEQRVRLAAEVDRLKKQIAVKDAEIEKLNNNVKLLKTQLGL